MRSDHHVVSRALVIALGVKMTGQREILGLAIDPCESEPFWHEFLKDLVSSGLGGAKLMISDAHKGLKKAIEKVLLGASQQSCTVHFMRNVPAHVPRAAHEMIAAYIRTIFAQPDQKSPKPSSGKLGSPWKESFPRV